MKQVARVTLVTGIALLLQSCSGIFDLRPSGSVDGDVIFSFYRAPEEARPARLPITQVYVQRRSGNEWRTVWALRGDRRMPSMRYGQVYRGFSIEHPPERLVRGGRYRVGASGGGLMGAAEFLVDRSGNVVVVRETI